MIINQLTKSILKIDPTPNFGTLSEFIHPLLTEVDFSTLWTDGTV